MLEFVAGVGAGILLALLLGHLERRRVSRRQRELARLQEQMMLIAWDATKALVRDCDGAAYNRLSYERNRATTAYYAALRGDQ